MPNVKDIAVKIQILNPEANAFHEPEATPVKDFSHQQVGSRQPGHDALNFGLRHDGRGAYVPFSFDGFNLFFKRLVEYTALQKDDCVQGLSLSGSRYLTFDCQVTQPRFDMPFAHLGGVDLAP